MNAQLREPDEDWTEADEAAELRAEYPPQRRKFVCWQDQEAHDVGIRAQGEI